MHANEGETDTFVLVISLRVYDVICVVGLVMIFGGIYKFCMWCMCGFG